MCGKRNTAVKGMTPNPISCIQEKKDIKEYLQKELHGIQLSKRNKQKLIDKIMTLSVISKNQNVVLSYLRSYLRMHKQSIELDGRESPVVIEITKKCQKNCVHCYSRHTGLRQEMSDEILTRIIRYARKHAKHVFFTGGEPTLDPRIVHLAETNPDMIFFVFTNGSTMTQDYAARLASLGNLIPLVGIDGATAESHDHLRGKGSYQEVTHAINLLQKNDAPWGYISLVTERNAHEVLTDEFIRSKTDQGAFIARYLEYLPVGPNPQHELILSGETYFYLEKRKKEIIKSGIIYMQETSQKKCHGLLFFDVDGNIKNCFCFHYAKYNVAHTDIKTAVQKIQEEWTSYRWVGECPVYSDPIGFKNHLEKRGWKKISTLNEPYLTQPSLARQLMRNYQRFLKIKKQCGIRI